MNKFLKEILSTSMYLLIVLLVSYVITNFVGQRTQVIGSSMETTLAHDDNLIADKISYRFTDPKRYDIIIFPFRYQEDTYYIKRIIGLPGETVQIEADGDILIDGEVLAESYGKEVIQNPGLATAPIILSSDEYFVLGDNRNNSSDSRDPSVNNIREEEIVGKAFIRIWPLNKFGILKHQ